MKINFACGKRVMDGWYNIDAVWHKKAPRAPELIYAAEFDKDGKLRRQVPLEDGCADRVICYHFIEHVYPWEADAVIAELRRLLRPGGVLAVECPDMRKACQNFVNGMNDQYTMWPLYGDETHRDPYMMHKYGYTPETLTALLKRAGFNTVHRMPPQTHGKRKNRDQRAEAIK